MLGALGLYIGQGMHWGFDPLANPQYGFQFYAPTKLPPGFSIKKRTINILTPDGKLYGITAELDFRTEDGVYSVTERKASVSPEDTTTALHNYDTNSVGVTCTQEQTPHKRSYRLCHWIDYGRISVYEIKFVEGSTYITTTFPAGLHQDISNNQLSDYVDSFVLSNTFGFTITEGGP